MHSHEKTVWCMKVSMRPDRGIVSMQPTLVSKGDVQQIASGRKAQNTTPREWALQQDEGAQNPRWKGEQATQTRHCQQRGGVSDVVADCQSHRNLVPCIQSRRDDHRNPGDDGRGLNGAEVAAVLEHDDKCNPRESREHAEDLVEIEVLIQQAHGQAVHEEWRRIRDRDPRSHANISQRAIPEEVRDQHTDDVVAGVAVLRTPVPLVVREDERKQHNLKTTDDVT
ncbi:hypothetical protein ON010_g17310 [Phytophthora cinnamomi]|nr:hypothetical protein ON010_g17310 [Phytophthora cinnamomi]